MLLNDRQVSDALNSTNGAVCIDKEIVDELDFGPREYVMVSDRSHRNVLLLVPAKNEKGWQLVDAILFEKEGV